ncbi:MAG: transcription factor S [Candidatus Aenigmatarchaeota archaeon]
MLTCPKCGNLLFPKKEKGKNYLVCRKCNYKTEAKKSLIVSSGIKEEKKEAIVISAKEEKESLPVTNVICPKCGNDKAFWWMQQTRSADEPPTVFYKCTKCNYTWRSYE